jgi:predicted GTPase
MNRTRVLILGAAGRDFHNFNVFFRGNHACEVVAFTATQIPGIAGRVYPPPLAGELYPHGIQIHPEDQLERLIASERIEQAILSYSDLSHLDVMHLASRVLAAGADFRLLGPDRTALASSRPVVAVCAVRTGCGKSQTSRYVADVLRAAGRRVAVVRHPMPYGDLVAQRVQRFASRADLDAAGDNITIEEREEYEPHVDSGTVVFAGVDYEAILRQAEGEGDVVIWDGGNNDLPFYRPDLWITVADPLRPGHELSHHPGEANFRAAHVLVINKANTAAAADVDQVRRNAAEVNPRAQVVLAASTVTAEDPDVIRGKRVLLIEDGPTLTHGGMSFGAGKVAADRYGAAATVDPRPWAVGSIRDVYRKYPQMGALLPAMGYYPDQIRELEQTIAQTDCDAVVVATPIDLRHLVRIDKPSTRVRYELEDLGAPTLAEVVRSRLRLG